MREKEREAREVSVNLELRPRGTLLFALFSKTFAKHFFTPTEVFRRRKKEREIVKAYDSTYADEYTHAYTSVVDGQSDSQYLNEGAR